MEKVICKKCGKSQNKKATTDGICVNCWNKKPKFFDVKVAEKKVNGGEK